MIDTLSLKTSIYDLATSGQLSTGYTSTDAVDEILKNIPSPSAKRKKLLTKDYQYGQKHTIPSSWRWVRLGEISSYGDTPEKTDADRCADDVWLLDLEDIEAGGKLLHKTRVLEKRSKGEKTIFTEGQILYSKLRPYLKKVLIADEDGISTPELISFDVFGGIDARYIVFCLLNTFTNKAIDARSYGIKMPRVDAGFMVNLPIPLPPISEQKYIADKVESVLSEIDSLADAQTRYTSDTTALKSKVIDAGIQGRLTEQLPEDGTAQELFEQIQKEKTCLVKEGKIKKQKPLPPIKPEEIPFEIPENWMWVRLGDLYTLTNGVASRGTKGGCPHPVLRLADLTDEGISTSNIRSIDLSNTEYESHRVNKNDLIIIRVNGSKDKVGSIYYYSKEQEISYCDHLFCAHRVSNNIEPKYVLLASQTEIAKKQISPLIKTTAGQNTISQGNIGKMIIPLPPLAEQRRIAERIEEILSVFQKHKSKER